MSSSQAINCELIECSRPIRFFIVSLMYNNITYNRGVSVTNLLFTVYLHNLCCCFLVAVIFSLRMFKCLFYERSPRETAGLTFKTDIIWLRWWKSRLKDGTLTWSLLNMERAMENPLKSPTQKDILFPTQRKRPRRSKIEYSSWLTNINN